MTRPPLRPFTVQSAIETVRLAEDGWNSRDPTGCRLPTAPTATGVTATSSSTVAQPSNPSLPENGRGSSTTASSRSYGLSVKTGSRCGSPTNFMTILERG